MCGVVGTLGKNSIDRALRGVELISYRGIRSRVKGDQNGAIGHVRLPIVGTGEEYDQPVCLSGYYLGFVGEILDFRDRDPEAECDLDLVVQTTIQEGPEGFKKFDGFWSVVVYDSRAKRLHGFVDYLDQKPLYFRHDRHLSMIASELDCIADQALTSLDEVYLSSVCKWGYCPEGWRTPYREIQKLLPGEYVCLQRGIPARTARIDVLKAVSVDASTLRKEIEEAVRRRVVASDVPLACLVSGGLDSSIVYKLSQRYRDCADIRVYHVENNESEACDLVAPEAFRLDSNHIDLIKALLIMQEPLDLGSLIPQVALAEAIDNKGGERVCLTGDGADEFFGGYGRSKRYDSQASDVWQELISWHLPRLDRVMMRYQIEVRSPFLARGVASAALALGRQLRIDKKILRDLFSDLLPKEILHSEKKPLRTQEVENDREKRSIELVKMFREIWRTKQCQEYERRN